MDKIFLVISVFLLLSAIKAHAISKVHVIRKIDTEWYDRIWSGSRPSVDNLTEEGLKYRKRSNLYAIAGFLTLGLYVMVNSASADCVVGASWVSPGAHHR